MCKDNVQLVPLVSHGTISDEVTDYYQFCVDSKVSLEACRVSGSVAKVS
jgi:hypothetical protein